MKRFFQGILLTTSLLTASIAVSASTTEITPAVKEANRQLVLNFYNQFFNHHETTEAAKVVADDYRQHNPNVPDGKAAFVNYFTTFFKKNPQFHARIIRSAVESDLVWLQVHATNGNTDRGQAILDIFRVKDGKIVEHWDIIQDVPEKAANNNTMF